jgi:Polyketide cyclase / dehydrase and lipid transport
MAKVLVRASIERPLFDVFALVSDHEKFLSGVSGTTTRIVKAGTAERNGLGCLREVCVGDRVRYVEEITQWQPPNSFEYLIREASIPIRHYGSRMDFAARQESTDVTWQAHFEVPIPIIGWAFAQLMKRRYESAFSAMLSQARVTLEKAS